MECASGLRDFWLDSDLDGWGSTAESTQACAQPAGFVGNYGDCDDADAAVHPGADDVCNAVDDDCDGISDPGMITWFVDQDGDGFGETSETIEGCVELEGYAAVGGDCDDHAPDRNPDAIESCNGLDDDCDGTDDEDFDADGDGHLGLSCAGGDDCDDSVASVFPGASEVCSDGLDNDCDGDGDVACRYDGVYDLEASFTKAFSAQENFAAGHRIEAGDVDGDGVQDLVVGTYYANGYEGGAYVMHDLVPGEVALDTVGSFIQGQATSFEGGRSLGVADANGDGYDDILIGAPDSEGVDAVLVLGPVPSDLTFDDAELQASCPDENECGHGLDLGDVNGDEIADAVIAAGEADDGGTNSGAIYIVYGPIVPEQMELQSAYDAKLIGAGAGLETGRYVRAGGDVNADGVNDIMATATYDSTGGINAGAVYVVQGPLPGVLDLSDADTILVGEDAQDMAGEGIAMGDMNGDGFDDMVVGSMAHGGNDGSVYVTHSPQEGAVDLAETDLVIRGEGAQRAGASVSTGSGGELLIGAPSDGTAGTGAGAAFLFITPGTGTLDTDHAAAIFRGESEGDQAGIGTALGDLDGDGWNEVVVGAPSEDTIGPHGGAVYVVMPE